MKCPQCGSEELRWIAPFAQGSAFAECQSEYCDWSHRPKDSDCIALAIDSWLAESSDGREWINSYRV